MYSAHWSWYLASMRSPVRIPIRYTVRVERTFEAIYENGMLRPLENLGLADRQHVRVTISESLGLADASDCFEPGEWTVAQYDDVSLEAVRHALSGIRGSLSDTVNVSREERS